MLIAYWKCPIWSLSIQRNVILFALPKFTRQSILKKLSNDSRGSDEQTAIT